MPKLPAHVPNQILALLKQGVVEQDAKNAVLGAGGTVIKTSSNGRLTAILIGSNDIESTMDSLRKSNCFESIQLNNVSKHQ